MSNIGLNGMSFLALAVALGAMGIALWRARRSPQLLISREQALEKRISELEGTVASLQRLLYEKEQQNGTLQHQVATLTARVQELERIAPQTAPADSAPKAAQQPTLLVVLGDDPALRIDLTVLREVEQYGWRVSRLFPVTKARLKQVLDRYRVNRRAIEYVHMAVHSGVEGLVFRNEVVTSEWLSDNLKSVRVLVINGCNSDALGDWLGVVPFVVTMREEIGHDDAALFARLFWVAVASGLSPEDAYYQARDRSPQSVSEFVELVG